MKVKVAVEFEIDVSASKNTAEYFYEHEVEEAVENICDAVYTQCKNIKYTSNYLYVPEDDSDFDKGVF